MQGALAIPDQIREISVLASRGTEQASTVVKELWQNNGGRLASDRNLAVPVLVLMDEYYQKRVAARDTQGRITNYELSLALTYRVDDAGGEVLLGEQTISRIKSLPYDEADVLGKTSEESALQELMRRELAIQAIRQMTAEVHHAN